MDQSVIGIRFREASKIYHFAPPDHPVHVGDYVVVGTAHGNEMGRVITVPDEDSGVIPSGVRPIVRMADRDDRDRAISMREKGEAMVARMRELVLADDLEMYVVAFQVNLSGTEATCHFQAEAVVDFRSALEMVESEFSMRVHMQQVGPRDRAKMIDGYDVCGLRLCCATWMTKFPKVGIRMAKDQQLALNPNKISGVCGRLFCCLTFEQPVYREMRGTLPKVGKRVSTPAGMGRVLKINILGQTVTLGLDNEEERIEVPASEIGMAVRIEDVPNGALANTDVIPVETGLPSFEKNASSKENEDSVVNSPPRRRRRRRRRASRSEQVENGELENTPPRADDSTIRQGENLSDLSKNDEIRSTKRRRRRHSNRGPS